MGTNKTINSNNNLIKETQTTQNRQGLKNKDPDSTPPSKNQTLDSPEHKSLGRKSRVGGGK